MREDLVSIITPVFNAEKYLEDTIESILGQNYNHWEVIIVDDYSIDRSSLIIEAYTKLDKRIRLISLEENKGVAFARNIAIKAAKGRYIAFLDSDDLWHTNKLSTQIDFMKKNNYYFTFSSYELIDDRGVKLNKIIKAPTEVNYRRLLKGNPIGCLTVIIDKEKIENIIMPCISHEDYATWLNIMKKGITAYGINENLALYRKTKNSLSSNKLKAITWTWNIYRNHEKLSFLQSVKSIGNYIINSSLKHMGL